MSTIYDIAIVAVVLLLLMLAPGVVRGAILDARIRHAKARLRRLEDEL